MESIEPRGAEAGAANDDNGSGANEAPREEVEGTDAAETSSPAEEKDAKAHADSEGSADLNKPESMDAVAKEPAEAEDSEGAAEVDAPQEAPEPVSEEAQTLVDDEVTTPVPVALPVEEEEVPAAPQEAVVAEKQPQEDPVHRAKHAASPTPNEVPAAATGSAFPQIPQEKRHRGLKALGIVLLALIIAVGVVYGAGVIIFSGRFLPHTLLGDHDISLMTNEEVVELLQKDAEDYRIEVRGDGFSYSAQGTDMGVSIDGGKVVNAIHQDLEAWQWPILLFQPVHDETDLMDVTFKRASFEPTLTEAINQFNATATPPENATIVYDEPSRQFIVKEEVPGTQLDPAATMEVFSEAVAALEPLLVLDEDQLVQPTVLSNDRKLVESAKLATGMVSADITLMRNGQPVREVNGTELSQFVAIDDKLDVTLKEDELDAWCDGLIEGFNTVGSERTYTRADGKVITVSGGSYGWEVDKEALKNSLMEAIKSGSDTQLEVPFVGQAAVYTAPGQRDWGNRYIDVDISEQHVRFYDEAGRLFWETDCISGAPDGKHDTVPGVWKLNDKESPSTLKGYEGDKKIYETKVTFWMPFERNSIGFHDATWQPGFGGTMYANGYGSHGCVNLSYKAAEELYGLIQVGDVVVVHS